MAKERDYAGKLYDTFSRQMEGFTKTEPEFRKALESPEYQKKVYSTLSNQMEGFSRKEDEFYNLLKKKENTVVPSASSGMGVSMDFKGKPQSGLEELNKEVLKGVIRTNENEQKELKKREEQAKMTDIQLDVLTPNSKVLPNFIRSGITSIASGLSYLPGALLDIATSNPVSTTGLAPGSAGSIESPKLTAKGRPKEIDNAVKYFYNLGNDFKGISEDLMLSSKLKAGIKNPNMDTISQFSNGNFSDGIKSLAIETGQTLTQTAAMIAGGAPIVGASMVGSNLGEEINQDGKISFVDLAQSVGKGVGELYLEKFFNKDLLGTETIVKGLGNLLTPAGSALKKEILEKGATVVKNEIIRDLKDVGKKVLEGQKDEILEETAAVGLSFFVDAIDQDKFNAESFNKLGLDMANSALIAATSGGLTSGLAARVSMQRLSREEKSNIERLQRLAEENITSTRVRDIALSEINNIRTGAGITANETMEKVSKLPLEKKMEALAIKEELDSVEDDLDGANDLIRERLEPIKAYLEAKLENLYTESSATTEPTIETENDKAIAQALSTPEETAKALESAKVFQPKKIEELTAPKIGDTATLFDKDGEVVENGVQVNDIDIETNMVTIVDSNGKEKKVPRARVNKTIEQVSQEFHSGIIAPELLTEIVTKDISDPDVNQQRRMSTQVTGVGQKNLIDTAPLWVKNLYDKFISSGDRNAVRALETRDSILANKRDKLSVISKKIANLLDKDPKARKDANTVLSQDYIDDKIDSFTNKKTDEAVSVLTGTELDVLREAYANPDTEDNRIILKEVNDKLKSKTKNGSKKEVDELIYSEVTKDKEPVRDLATKWVNVGRESKTAEDRKNARKDIEEQLLRLPNGEKIIETLKEARLNTIQAKRNLLKTKPGRELLSTMNESRQMIDEFSKWVESNLAALNIKDKDIGQSIINNSGLYIKKTYDYWTDKEFTLDEKLGKQAVDSIKRALLPQRLSALASTKKFESATEPKRADMIQVLKDKAASDASKIFTDYIAEITAKKEYKPSNVFPNNVKVQSKNTWEREFINEEFGKILGKSEDAIDRLHASVVAQAQIESAAEMGMILEQLSGGDFYNSRDSAIDSLLKSGMSEVEAGQHLGKNYKEVSDKYSPLNGKLIPTEIYDMVYEELKDTHHALFNWLKAATVLWRMSKTVFNPSGHITNTLGGNIAIAEQGHLVDSQTINFLVDRFKLMGGSNKISNEAKAIKSKMVDTGLWGSSVSIGEINLLLKYANDLGSGDKNISQQALITIKKEFNERFGGIKRYYSATDDFSKLILFHKKKDVFAKKLYGKPYESLTTKEEAIVDANIAERVKQNMPTSSRIPKFAKAIIGSVVIGDFQGFRFGAFTSFANTIGNALGDINKGLSDKSLSKEQKKAYLLDGARTLTGSASIFALDKAIAGGIVGLSSMALGKMAKGLFDEKEDEDKKPIGSRFDMYQNIKNSFYMPGWGMGQNVIVTSDDGKGNLQLMNLSNTFPNDESYQLFGAQENLPLINLDGPSGFSSVFDKTISLNAVLNIFNNANKGRDNWNRPIGNSYLEKAMYVASEFSIPSIRHLHKEAVIYAKNQEGTAPEDFSEEDKRSVTKYNYLKGILASSPQIIKRTYPLRMNQQIFYNLKDFYEGNDTKFDRLTEREKYERIKKLEPVRNAFLEMKKYNIHQKDSTPAERVFESVFKGLRGKVSEEEQNYILTGEKPLED